MTFEMVLEHLLKLIYKETGNIVDYYNILGFLWDSFMVWCDMYWNDYILWTRTVSYQTQSFPMASHCCSM
jgi:DNA modification methylase